MKANLEDISAVKKKVTVEIEAKEVDNRLDKAYREYGKKAKIRGFRPGKIPRRILENYFAEQVVEDVTREIVNDTLAKAMEETKAVPVSMPVIENESLKVNQTFKYSALVEVRPKFELKDYKGLQVEKEIYSVNDQDVEKHLREIRETHGKLINIDEDRGVAEGDYVILEYEGFEGEKALEGIKSHNFLLRIGSNDFHPDFEKALIGIHKGDQTEIRVDFEDSYYHAKLAGKSVDFKVKVIEIKKMELPELNDEFASKLGADFDSLEALKEKIKEDLTTREEKRIDKELKERILKQISDQVSFELPESLVEAEIGYAIENIKQNSKVSFCAVGETNVLPSKFGTEYESVVVFGAASQAKGTERYNALIGLLEKYSADFIEEGKAYIEQKDKVTKVIKIEISDITGKRAQAKS